MYSYFHIRYTGDCTFLERFIFGVLSANAFDYLATYAFTIRGWVCRLTGTLAVSYKDHCRNNLINLHQLC